MRAISRHPPHLSIFRQDLTIFSTYRSPLSLSHHPIGLFTFFYPSFAFYTSDIKYLTFLYVHILYQVYYDVQRLPGQFLYTCTNFGSATSLIRPWSWLIWILLEEIPPPSFAVCLRFLLMIYYDTQHNIWHVVFFPFLFYFILFFFSASNSWLLVTILFSRFNSLYLLRAYHTFHVLFYC